MHSQLKTWLEMDKLWTYTLYGYNMHISNFVLEEFSKYTWSSCKLWNNQCCFIKKRKLNQLIVQSQSNLVWSSNHVRKLPYSLFSTLENQEHYDWIPDVSQGRALCKRSHFMCRQWINSNNKGLSRVCLCLYCWQLSWPLLKGVTGSSILLWEVQGQV